MEKIEKIAEMMKGLNDELTSLVDFFIIYKEDLTEKEIEMINDISKLGKDELKPELNRLARNLKKFK